MRILPLTSPVDVVILLLPMIILLPTLIVPSERFTFSVPISILYVLKSSISTPAFIPIPTLKASFGLSCVKALRPIATLVESDL